MNRRRFAVLAVVLLSVNVFFWLAGSGFALSTGGGLLQTLLGGRLIRAEVVWQAPDGTIRDSQLYRGVITAVSPTSITLREKDRPTDVIPVAPDAVVRSGYLVETTSALKRGMRVLVERPANEPADTIQIEGLGA